MPKNLRAGAWSFIRAAGYSLLCYAFLWIGSVMFVQARAIPETLASGFWQSVSTNVASTGFVLWLVFVWRMDATRHIIQEQDQQQMRIQELDKKLVATHILLQQVLDTIHQEPTNSIPGLEQLDKVTASLSNLDALSAHIVHLSREIALLKAKQNGRRSLLVTLQSGLKPQPATP